MEMNDAKRAVMAALADVGGWTCAYQLQGRGASASSAQSLAREGLIERRYIESYFRFYEWRLPQESKSEEGAK